MRAVFVLTERTQQKMFDDGMRFGPLAYVEWFSAFPSRPHKDHRMYKITRSFRSNHPDYRHASIIPVGNIRRTVQLLPVFGPVAPREWTSQNVLECCSEFYVDPFLDEQTFMTLGRVQ